MLDWMRRVHVSRCLRNDCFAGTTIYKWSKPKSDDPTYVIQYQSLDGGVSTYRDPLPPRYRKSTATASAGVFRASRQIRGSGVGRRSQAGWHCIRFKPKVAGGRPAFFLDIDSPIALPIQADKVLKMTSPRRPTLVVPKNLADPAPARM